MPRVSVIVPTFARPVRLRRAIDTALAQSMRDLEVIVVVDDSEAESRTAAQAVADDRVRVILPNRRLGNAEARNVGIREAKGAWIALLDDDDWWETTKLETQLPVAEETTRAEPIVSCFFRMIETNGSFVWPRRKPMNGEPLSEYIFCRHRAPTVEGVLQTSTLLASRDLFLQVPFQKDLERLVDLDWLLRAADHGAVLKFPAGRQVLSTYEVDGSKPRVTDGARWAWERQWARERRALLTDRSFAGFLLTSCSLAAARNNDYRAFFPLVLEAVRDGRASPAEIAFHTANMAIPAGAKRAIATMIESFVARRSASGQIQG